MSEATLQQTRNEHPTGLQPAGLTPTSEEKPTRRGRKPKQETIHLTQLVYENREFTFAREMPVTVTQKGKIWVYEAKEPNIVGYEENKEDAFYAFTETFDACWELIACERDDKKLTPRAQQMKTAFKSLVANVRQIE